MPATGAFGSPPKPVPQAVASAEGARRTGRTGRSALCPGRTGHGDGHRHQEHQQAEQHRPEAAAHASRVSCFVLPGMCPASPSSAPGMSEPRREHGLFTKKRSRCRPPDVPSTASCSLCIEGAGVKRARRQPTPRGGNR